MMGLSRKLSGLGITQNCWVDEILWDLRLHVCFWEGCGSNLRILRLRRNDAGRLQRKVCDSGRINGILREPLAIPEKCDLTELN